ncbi:hypothetical protein V6N13_057311 [Hibiscus sabdariffa]
MSTGSREREKFSLNFPDLSLSWAFHVYGLFVAPIMELAPGGGRVGLGHHWAVGWIWLAGWSCRIDIRQWRTEVGLKVNLELRGWNLESSLLKGNCSLILWETDWKIRKGKGGTRERGILKEAIRVDGKRRFGFLAPRRVQRWPEMVESIPRKNREEFLWKTMITCGGREIPATRESAELDEGTWKGCRRQGYIFGKGGTFSRYGIQSQYFGRNGDGTRVATKRRLEVINHGKIMSLGIGEVWSTTFLNCRTVMWVVTNGAQVLAQFYFKGMIYSGTQWELINEISEVFMLIMHGLHEFTLFYVWVPANKLSKKEKGAVYKSGPRYQGITTADFIRRQPKQWRFKRIIKGFIIYFTIQNDIVRDWGNHSDNKQASHSTMADEVAGLMGNLKFSEEELVDVNNIGEEMVETMEGTEKWAVGKLISPVIVDSGLLIRVFFAVWKETPLEEASPLGPNMFLFKFKQEEFRDSVLNRCPWSFDGELLALKPFDGLLSPNEYNFHPLHIWLRVYQVPLGLMNQKMGEKIGNIMGVHKAVDLREGEGRMGEYLRLQTEIDSSRPLKRIGHGWELCVERPVEFQGPFQFGEWLKVDLGKERQTARRKLGIVYADRKFERERKEGSGDHMLEGQTEEGRILQQKGKDKMVGTSTKMRTMKRTLKCKNEVCNPVAAKKSRTTSNLFGEEDACSEATSPLKNSAPTVEAGSQPRRES